MKLLALLVLIAPAYAGAPDENWFRGLKQPTTGATCCDIADCRLTTADWYASGWWAEVQGEVMLIPDEKVLKRQSPDGEAYVCSGYGRKIYCFIPPNMGF